MNSGQLMYLAEETFERVRSLQRTKGKDYAGEDDALSNFKDAAAGLGVGPMTIWTVYAHKHWSAIVSFCKNGQTESEPIMGRIDDLITYLVLLKGLIVEAQGEDASPAKPVYSDPQGLPEHERLMAARYHDGADPLG